MILATILELFQVLVDTWFSSMFMGVVMNCSTLSEESNFLNITFIYELFRA